MRFFFLFFFLFLNSISYSQFYRLDDVSKSTIDDAILAYKNDNSIVGVSVGVVKDGAIVYLKGFGSADLQNNIDASEYTLYRLASVHKSITGLMSMRLMVDGVLDMNADIRDYVPEYPEKPQGIITSEELLSNESGIIHYSGTSDGQYCSENYNAQARDTYIANHLDDYDPIEAINIFKDQQICFTPGEHYQYTTWGFCLMGAVLERAADKPYDEILFDELNQTLCLPYLQPEYQEYKPYPNATLGYEFDNNGNIIPTPTTYTDYTDVSYKLPAGGSLGSVIDLSLIIKGVVNNELFDEETVDFWGFNHTPEDGETSDYGYGINSGLRDGNRLFSHSGSQAKTATLLYFSPDNRNGLIIMANTKGVSLWDLAREIYDYLPNVVIEGEEFNPPPPNIFNIDYANPNCSVSANDLPCNAFLVPTDGSIQGEYDNSIATSSAEEQSILPPNGTDCVTSWCETGSNEATNSLWFKFIAPSSGSVEISTCGMASFDTQIALYSVSDCNNYNTFSLLAANDDGPGGTCSNYSSLMEVGDLTPGNTYYLIVDGYDGQVGTFDIYVKALNVTSVQEAIARGPELKVIPNPNQGQFRLQYNGLEDEGQLQIVNTLGAIVYKQAIRGMTNGQVEVNLQHLPAGIYMARLGNEQQLSVQKIIIE